MDRRTFLKTTGAGLTVMSMSHGASAAAAAKTPRVGIIGPGWYGKVDLLRLLQVAPVEVVGVCDVDQHMADGAADIVAERQPSKKRPRRWRAFMEYGNGILGDMCVHMYDMVRWMLKLGWPSTISSSGGILVQTDSAANITDTQIATFQHPDFSVTWQHRSPQVPSPMASSGTRLSVAVGKSLRCWLGLESYSPNARGLSRTTRLWTRPELGWGHTRNDASTVRESCRKRIS